MLIEFSCSNYKSILSKAVFSMLASSEDGDNLYKVDKFNVLKSAVIYGANGAGKTNFINAIEYMKWLVKNSIYFMENDDFLQTQHKLAIGKESNYEIKFIKNNIYYYYMFILKAGKVEKEELYYSPDGRKTKIFTREDDKFTEGSKFKGKLSACKNVLNSKKMLLSCAAVHSKVKEIMEAFEFFDKDIIFYSLVNEENWFNYSLYKINKDSKMKKVMIDVMNALGIEIKDIEVKIEKRKVDKLPLPFNQLLNDEAKKQLLDNGVVVKSAFLVYKQFKVDLINDESNGIKKIFGLFCPILDIIMNDKVLICDELENSLHETVISLIVEKFNMQMLGKFNPQLIFTTHDSNLLSSNLFRRDQIWFAEMNMGNRDTNIYSLVELKNVRKEEKYEKGYISGKYGAIPILNFDFDRILGKKSKNG